jgi:ABC-type ATPase involved in cell division
MGIVIVVQRQPQLLEMVATLRPTRCFPRLLHGGEQQRHKDANDGDHDE